MINDTGMVCWMLMLTNAVDPDLTAQHLRFGRDILHLD